MESIEHAGADVAQLSFSLPPVPSRLLRARDRIRDYLQQHCSDQVVIDDVVLCVEEACTNVIRHSGSRENMEILLQFVDDDLVAEVRDRGRGFDVDAFDAAATPDVNAPGGRGLFLMARLMDELTLSRDGGLDVRMVKRRVARCRVVPVESGLGDLSASTPSAHRETRLRALLEEIDEAFFALDWEYRYMHANTSAERLTGRPREELLGRRPWEVFPRLAGSPVDRAYREAMELGKPSVVEYRSVLTGDWLEMRVYPTAAGISAYFRGINERMRIQADRERLLRDLQAQGEELQALTRELRREQEETAQRARMSVALNDIAASITLLVDYEEILTRVVAQAGAALSAESSSICTLEDDAWVPRYLWQLPDGVAGVPIPRERVSYANIGVESRRAVAVDDCESDPRVDVDLQRSWNVRSVAMAPLLVRDTVVAAIFFNYHAQPHTFTAHEVDFIGKAAAIISGALENARLLQQLDRVATTLQENLIHPLPAMAGLDLGRVSETAFASDRVGGDFSDVFAIDESHVAVLIGDVGGKGIRAARLTETVHTAVNSFALVDRSPAFILCKTNDLLLRSAADDEQFVTAFLLVVDLKTGQVSYASAGHPAPVAVGAFSCALIDAPSGLPLGTFACDYVGGDTTLEAGETLVLYTDGVIEARRDGELFGERRLLETVAAARDCAPQEVAERLRHAAVEFAGRLKDDLQILVLKRTGAAA
jgi:PAS domain S-box-containing protein